MAVLGCLEEKQFAILESFQKDKPNQKEYKDYLKKFDETPSAPIELGEDHDVVIFGNDPILSDSETPLERSSKKGTSGLDVTNSPLSTPTPRVSEPQHTEEPDYYFIKDSCLVDSKGKLTNSDLFVKVQKNNILEVYISIDFAMKRAKTDLSTMNVDLKKKSVEEIGKSAMVAILN